MHRTVYVFNLMLSLRLTVISGGMKTQSKSEQGKNKYLSVFIVHVMGVFYYMVNTTVYRQNNNRFLEDCSAVNNNRISYISIQLNEKRV